ncbi:MAG: hypothetical protein ACRDL9_11570 [Trebonia sp.]
MDLALRTTASPAAIWVIVVVSVVLLAFWLAMVMVYAARPDPRLRRVADRPGPVLGGIHMAERPAQPGVQAPEPEAAQVPGQREPQPQADTAGSGAGDGRP